MKITESDKTAIICVVLFIIMSLIAFSLKAQNPAWIEISRDSGIQLRGDLISTEYQDGNFIAQLDLPPNIQSCAIVFENCTDSVFTIDNEGRLFLMNVTAFSREQHMILRFRAIDKPGNIYECDMAVFKNTAKIGTALFIQGKWKLTEIKL